MTVTLQVGTGLGQNARPPGVQPGTRDDIQALRGWAVLLVLLYHANIPGFEYGFLGVDVFFVISGYLITKHIVEQIQGKRFTFQSFYLRRARRILPAAYCTLAIPMFLSPLFLTTIDYNNFLDQFFGAITFTANFVLWQQTGYFQGEANTKPLLHMWSLSIEEQFYLLLPLILVTIKGRFRTLLLVLAFLVSLGLCLSLVTNHPSAVFYLLPTRAWELLAGAMCAFAMPHKGLKLIEHPMQLLALLALLITPTFGIDALVHPRIGALLVVSATAAIILLGTLYTETPPAYGFRRFFSPLVRLGDWSYSLYLVHWPLFVFFGLAFVGDLPVLVAIFLLPVAVMLA